MTRLAAALLLACALAGCGGARGHGTATLWVTRNRGAQVVFAGQVPAGLSAMQALERKLKVTTRYGGRFVQSIGGIDGSLSGQRDWFYFVNGVESDSGATNVRLRDGDVEWWDYRSWSGGGMSVPVVLGAFPEPFLHGYDGKMRPAVVVGPPSAGVRSLARLLHARVAWSAPRGANVLIVLGRSIGPVVLAARPRPGGGVAFDYTGDPGALAAHPGRYRYRYRVP